MTLSKRAAKVATSARPKRKKNAALRTEKGRSGYTPTFPDRPIGRGNPPRETQIKPGQVLNPGGRPKVLSVAYRTLLETVDPDDEQGRTWAEIIAAGQALEASHGNTSAAAEIRKATEGDLLLLLNKSDDELINILLGQRAAPAHPDATHGSGDPATEGSAASAGDAQPVETDPAWPIVSRDNAPGV